MGETMDKLIIEEKKIRSEICGEKGTDKDRFEIDEDMLRFNMFVEAGAGAGKTFTIVQRVLNQLCTGKKPSEIVVITFTNKAAEELRGRIARDLNDRIRDSRFSAYKDKLSDALSHIDDMNISTIHSFCFKLLKERCFDAALPIDIGLLDNEGTKVQKDLLFEKWLAGLKAEDWDNLYKCDPNKKTRREIKKEIKSIYSAVCTMPKERQVHVEKPSIAVEEKDRVYREFEQVLVNMVNKMDPAAKVTCYKDILDYSDKLGDNDTFLGSGWKPKDGKNLITTDGNGQVDHARFWNVFLTMEEGRKSDETGKVGFTGYRVKKKGVFRQGKYVKSSIKDKDQKKKEEERLKEWQTGLFEEALSYVEDNIDTLNQIMNEAITEYRSIICQYAQNAKEYYAANCSITELTNDALLELTRDMILNNKGAQEYFAKKYACFYVDEFQDTDSIQEAFIWKLASQPDNENELRDGALFIVGDPKQSIYRFRGAEPQVYLDVKARMKEIQDQGGNAKVYDLMINFRSNDLVIKWVNDKFGATVGFKPIMTGRDGQQYAYQNMLPMNTLPDEYKSGIDDNGYAIRIKPDDKEHLLAGVYKFDKPEGGEDSHIDTDEGLKDINEERNKTLILEGPDKDMQDLCDLIINLCDEDKNYFIYNKGEKRKVRYSDILVLCASKGKMNSYLEYMSLRGIPVQIAGSTDPKSIMEMNAFVWIFEYISNQKSRMSRIAAFEAFRCLDLTEKEFEIDLYSRAIIKYLDEECRGKTPYAIALNILKHLSVILKKNRVYSAFEIKAVQAKIMQMIETVCRDNYGTPKDIAVEFRKYLETEIEHELSLEQKSNAVQFMNTHKSKGLEGNIVIFVDRRGKKPVTKEGFLRDNEYYYKPKQYMDYKKEEDEELLSERRRLEYVTATRAGQVLIFMDKTGKIKDGPYFHGAEGAQYNLTELQSVAPVILDDAPHQVTVSKDAKYDLEEEEKECRKEIIEINEEDIIPSCQRISPSNFESGVSATKNRARYRARKAGLIKNDEDENIETGEMPDEPEIQDECAALTRPTGNILGIAMHRSLELLVDRYKSINDDPDRMKEVIKACVRQAISESMELLSEEDIVIYNDFLSAVVGSYYEKLREEKWLEEASEYHTELRFSYYENGTDGESNQLFFANKHLPEDKKLKKAPVWTNGSADLVLRFNAGQPDERILVVDYKSDNDHYLTEEEFNVSMSEKYIGQLDNYRYAMQKLFGVPSERISMRVVSFSQKDEDGNNYKDKRIRVRVTMIDEKASASVPVHLSKTKPKTVSKPGRKGSIEHYSIFGKEHTGTQSEMMIDVLKTLMEKHFDKREELAKLSAIKLDSLANLRAGEINYFKGGKEFEYNGIVYSIGTSFGKDAKMSVIRRAIKICNESQDIFVVHEQEH